MNETQKDFAFIFNSLKLAVQEICQEDYQPTILIADGSAAIENGFREAYNHLTHRVMCWAAHAIQNIDKHLNLINPNRLSANNSIFVRGVSLLNEKWADEETFIRYFNAQWVEQLKGWYEWFPG